VFIPKCDAQSSRRNFIRSMLQEPTPLAVLDGACPTVSESIAEISPIPQVIILILCNYL